VSNELPLENYVERRERCQAYRFRHPDQVVALANLLRARSYTFTYDAGNYGWTLTVESRLSGCATECSEIVVHADDFIRLVNAERDEYEIVPWRDFQQDFEPDEASSSNGAACG
jgi:hypothetical protein